MLYVSIGRNVGEAPMPSDKWESFQTEVIEAIYDDTFTEPDTIAYGNSRYGSMREETCVMVWFDVCTGLGNQALTDLGLIAVEYGQECIAWSVSETQFVEGVK